MPLQFNLNLVPQGSGEAHWEPSSCATKHGGSTGSEKKVKQQKVAELDSKNASAVKELEAKKLAKAKKEKEQKRALHKKRELCIAAMMERGSKAKADAVRRKLLEQGTQKRQEDTDGKCNHTGKSASPN